MANYPFLVIHSCTTDVINVDYVDITFNINASNIMSITAISDNNINVFVKRIFLAIY